MSRSLHMLVSVSPVAMRWHISSPVDCVNVVGRPSCLTMALKRVGCVAIWQALRLRAYRSLACALPASSLAVL